MTCSTVETPVWCEHASSRTSIQNGLILHRLIRIIYYYYTMVGSRLGSQFEQIILRKIQGEKVNEPQFLTLFISRLISLTAIADGGCHDPIP